MAKDNFYIQMLSIGRCGAATCVVGDCLYVIGGGDKLLGGEQFKSVEMINLQCTSKWTAVTDMLMERQYATASALDGECCCVFQRSSSRLFSTKHMKASS